MGFGVPERGAGALAGNTAAGPMNLGGDAVKPSLRGFHPAAATPNCRPGTLERSPDDA